MRCAHQSDTKLALYALYKQATEGDNNRDAPSMFSFVARSKHDAWAKLKGMSADQAKDCYVDKLLEVDAARFTVPAAVQAAPSPVAASASPVTTAASPVTTASPSTPKPISSIALTAVVAKPTPAKEDDAPKEPRPLRRVSEFEARFNKIFVDSGALRTFMINFLLVYNVRFGLALVVRLVTLARSSPRTLLNLGEILSEKHLHFREEAVRMGLFVASFSGLYISVRAALAAPGGAAEDKDRAWWASLSSGTIAGALSILWMDPSWHRTLSLYMATRWLQCAYNHSKARGYFHFWGSSWAHGDSLLFALSSAQIMYSYVMRPNALPPSYYAFIRKQGPLDEVVLQAVRDNCRDKAVDVKALFAHVQAKGGAEAVKAMAPYFPDMTAFPRVVPERALHPSTTSGTVSAGLAFWGVARQIFGVYLSLALVPAVVLRFQHFLKRPGTMSMHAVQSALQSTVFLATFCGSYQGFVCAQRHLLDAFGLKDHKAWYYVAGLLSSLSILIERKSRRSELALYAFPRAADAAWSMLYDRKLMIRVTQGEIILFAMSMGGLMAFYETDRSTMSPLVVNVFERFVPDDVLHPRANSRVGATKLVVGKDGLPMRKILESFEFGELRSDTPSVASSSGEF